MAGNLPPWLNKAGNGNGAPSGKNGKKDKKKAAIAARMAKLKDADKDGM